jgi:hypothetical protein
MISSELPAILGHPETARPYIGVARYLRGAAPSKAGVTDMVARGDSNSFWRVDLGSCL